jgi:hypothetical protein
MKRGVAGIIRVMKTSARVSRFSPHLVRSLALLLLLAAPAAGAWAADDAALLRCRALSDAAARLACYDALPVQSAAPLRTAPAAAAGPAPAAAPAAVTPPAAPAAAVATAPAAAQRFGQESRDEPQSITSQIAGVFEGWGPNTRIKLANGQVWQVTDGSEGLYHLQSPKVTVRRALLGGFQLEIEGAKRSPRVRRVE